MGAPFLFCVGAVLICFIKPRGKPENNASRKDGRARERAAPAVLASRLGGVAIQKLTRRVVNGSFVTNCCSGNERVRKRPLLIRPSGVGIAKRKAAVVITAAGFWAGLPRRACDDAESMLRRGLRKEAFTSCRA